GIAVANAVGPAGPGAADHARNMVRNQGAAEVHLIKRFHQFVHVRVPIIRKGFHKVRDPPADIAEMNLPELVLFAQARAASKTSFPICWPPSLQVTAQRQTPMLGLLANSRARA